MLGTFALAFDYPAYFFRCVLLAAIPVVVWFLFFGRPLLHRKGHILLTFLTGMVAGGVILWYQNLWGNHFNFVFFALEPQNFKFEIESLLGSGLVASFLIFLSVGFLEEYLKHWMTKKTDHTIFESIDDVIEFSIVGALGFSFLENIGYFLRMAVSENMDGLFSLFFVRSVFVVFIHVLCSGIYGYFYGLGFFATPVMKRREKKGIHTFIPDILHRFFHFRRDIVFQHEMTTLGLLIAMTLHGVYDFFLNVNLSLGSIAGREIPAHIVVFPIILVGGFSALNFLLARKEDQERFGRLERRDVFFLEKAPEVS